MQSDIVYNQTKENFMNKAESKRILFTFDSKTLEDLESVVKLGKFGTLADAVRASIRNMATMEEAQAEVGAKVEVHKIIDGQKEKLQVKL
jgi:Arc/MetJ-type ribon-helix-helix transcriptional regulator